jgi:hypothetical protein
MTKHRRIRLPAFLLAFCAALLPFAAPVSAQEPAAVCVLKTDRTGGKMRFTVRSADAAQFTAAGFQTVSCPASLDSAAQAIGEHCGNLRALNAQSRQFIQELYGLSLESMCGAHDAWMLTRAAQ